MAATNPPDPPSHVVHHAATVTSGRHTAAAAMEADYAAAHHWLAKALAATRRQILESAGVDPEMEMASAEDGGGEQRRVGAGTGVAGTAANVAAGPAGGGGTTADHDDKRRRVGSLGRPGGTRSVADESVVANLGRGAAVAASTSAKENAPAKVDQDQEEKKRAGAAAKKGKKKKAAGGIPKKAAGGAKKKMKVDDDAAAAAAAPPTLDVYSLKVAQLRAELRSRGVDASGLKRDLQARLAEQIERERRDEAGQQEDTEDEEESAEDEVVEEEEEEEENEGDEMYVEEGGEIVEEVENGSQSKESASPAAAVSSTQMAAASDFPGVDVQALAAKKKAKAEGEAKAAAVAEEEADDDDDDASIGYDDAMEVDSASAVPPAGTAKEEDDDDDDDDDDVDMEDAPSTTATATANASTANRVTTSDGQGLKHDDVSTTSSTVGTSSSISPKKKGIKKMLQATANLFSPSKKNGSGKSPKATTAAASDEAENSSEISDMLVSPIRPDNATTTTAAATSAPSHAIAPPSESKVKEASNFFSQFTTDQAVAVPPPSKVGSALKTPAVRAGLASAAASTAASAKTSVGSKGSATSASSSQTGESTASKYTSIKSQHRLKELQENAAARKIRLAELRAKSKPVPVAKSDSGGVGGSNLAVTAAPLSSVAKAKELSTADKLKEEKRKLLAAQMREKHFAETAAAKKQAETTAAATTATKPEAASASETAAATPVIPAMSSTPSQPQQQPKQQQPNSQQQQPPHKSKTPPQQKTARPEILSPMDTYEMSDRDEDSSDYDSEEEAKPKKRIPRWARKENLIPALEQQFLDGPHRMDPDAIFPEVSTCDLESIFKNKKARYKKRTSSANWAKDKVTAAEKLVYSRAMGFGGKSKSNKR